MKQFYLLICLCSFAFSPTLMAQSTGNDTTVYRDSTDRCGFGPISFRYTVDSANPFTLHFIPSPNDTGYSYYWSFGDGTVDSTDRTPTHTFPSPREYFVGLMVTKTGVACSDRTTQTILIPGPPPPPPPPPSCNAGFYPSSQGDLIRVYPTDTIPGALSIWNFGDSAASVIGLAPTHIYTHPGTYVITHIISDTATHCTDTASQTLWVAGDSTLGGDTTIVPPPVTCSSSFTYRIDSLHPSQVSLYGNALPFSDSTSYSWMISSDSATATPPITPVILIGRQTVFTFPDTGTYEVILSTTSPSGCTSYAAQVIQISQSGSDHLIAYPDPVRDVVHVNLFLQQAGPIHITLFGATGNLMGGEQTAGVRGLNILSIPVRNLPTGIYFMHLQYGKTSSESRFQKL